MTTIQPMPPLLETKVNAAITAGLTDPGTPAELAEVIEIAQRWLDYLDVLLDVVEVTPTEGTALNDANLDKYVELMERKPTNEPA